MRLSSKRPMMTFRRMTAAADNVLRKKANMKTNHQREFKAPTELKAGYFPVAPCFKGIARRTFRRVEREAMLEVRKDFSNFDGVVFPTKVQHGEDSWFWD